MEINKISEDDLQVNKCLIDWPQVPILESPSVCSAIHGVDSVTEIIIVVLLSWDTNAAPGNVREAATAATAAGDNFLQFLLTGLWCCRASRSG